MRLAASRVYYDVQHYLNLKNFTPPEASDGFRKVRLRYKITQWSIFVVIAAFLVVYLYSLALDKDIQNGNVEPASWFSPLFFTSLGGATVALPLAAIIVWTLRRYFVQPVFTYTSMFLHGAGFSVLASLVVSGFTVNTYDNLIAFTQSNPLSFFATVHAPFFEELFKGLGLIYLLMILPNFIRTPHDGVIYGMLAGFGFAFTENVQYFIQQGDTSEGFWLLIVMRVLASLLTHATFTAATGLIMAYFWCKYGSFMKASLGWVLGLIVAASLHALWNGASSVGLFLFVYLLMFLPLFIATTTLMRKSAVMYDNTFNETLNQYSEAGWFPKSLYSGMFPKATRKRTIRFMEKKQKKQLRLLASNLQELVFVRRSIEQGKAPERFAKRERELLLAFYSYQESQRNQQA